MRISEALPTPLPSLTRMETLMLVENRAGEGTLTSVKVLGKLGCPLKKNPTSKPPEESKNSTWKVERMVLIEGNLSKHKMTGKITSKR